MPETSPPSPAVVVGIDGSRGGIDAALWAIDEAVERDLPLRLVYAIEPREAGTVDCDSVAHDFASAEIAVRQAAMAIESVDKPVKIEVEIVQGRAVTALLAASHSAAAVCVGALGINRATGKRVGSTVSALLARARCPVAIVRQSDSISSEPRWVVTEFDGSPDGSTVLGHALDEARLRKAPLHVVTSWRPGFPDIHDAHASAQARRQTKANLERSLARYRRLYPEVKIRAVAVAGSPLNYLVRHADSIQLIVLSHEPSDEMSEFAGPASRAALHGVNCSVLISERHGAL
ncbi:MULTISPECIES: universal stress protein [unclassified Mycobacterium]|uniref:universal stress protein n=1 Tax=unclassified Mycobacterium TaxID=2642494 RepID=UPI0029C78022|nr:MULTISPECIES: universal stress protein [unclassified Mycobacterium]